MSEQSFMDRRRTAVSEMPPDEFLKYAAGEAIKGFEGLRGDVQKLHGSVEGVLTEFKHIVEDQKENKVSTEQKQTQLNDHDRRIVALETRVIVLQWVFTILIPLAGILSAIWPRK